MLDARTPWPASARSLPPPMDSDHPRSGRAAAAPDEPAADGGDVLEETPVAPRTPIPHHGPQTAHPATPMEPIRCGRQEPLTGQPVGLIAQVVAHPGEVIDQHHTRPRTLGRRGRRICQHRAVRRGDAQIADRVSSVQEHGVRRGRAGSAASCASSRCHRTPATPRTRWTATTTGSGNEPGS